MPCPDHVRTYVGGRAPACRPAASVHLPPWPALGGGLNAARNTPRASSCRATGQYGPAMVFAVSCAMSAASMEGLCNACLGRRHQSGHHFAAVGGVPPHPQLSQERDTAPHPTIIPCTFDHPTPRHRPNTMCELCTLLKGTSVGLPTCPFACHSGACGGPWWPEMGAETRVGCCVFLSTTSDRCPRAATDTARCEVHVKMPVGVKFQRASRPWQSNLGTGSLGRSPEIEDTQPFQRH